MDKILQYFTDFTEQQQQQLAALATLYKEWNEKINVISRKDIDSIYLHHVLHSLSIAAITGFAPGSEIIDIGCGGGFPGIPLAIFFPDVKFHLVDSIAKKLSVVSAICEDTKIHNVTIQHTRVEQIKNRKFDYAISRAVAPLKDLWQWGKPLLKKGGDKVGDNLPSGLICLKGGDLHQEISESLTRPTLYSIYDIFPEPFFQEKYIVYVKR